MLLLLFQVADRTKKTIINKPINYSRYQAERGKRVLASGDTGQQNGLGRPEDQTRDAENQMSRWQKKQPQTDVSYLEEYGENKVSDRSQ